jgi:hypothetical protein
MAFFMGLIYQRSEFLDVTRGGDMDTILFPKWENCLFRVVLQKNFMKNIFRSLPILVLFALSFTGCEKETLVSPDLVITNGLDVIGGQQVPAVTTNGTGNLDLRYDKSSKQLTLTFAWGNLADSVTAMHIHGPALPGVAGPVLIPFTNFTKGRYGAHTQTVLVNEVSLKEAELLNNQYYINIHTKKYPAGEIRGQITFE